MPYPVAAARGGVSGGGVAYLVRDTFTDTDNVSLDAHTPEVGGLWTEHVGNWQMLSNRAALVTDSADAVATIEAGAADVEVTVTFAVVSAGGGSVQRVIVRSIDATHYWLITQQDGAGGGGNYISLWYRNGGAYTNYQTKTYTWVNGDVVKVQLLGDSIRVLVNDVPQLWITSATANAATRHGISASRAVHQYDNFIAQALSSIQPARYIFPAFKLGESTILRVLESNDGLVWSQAGNNHNTTPQEIGDFAPLYVDSLWRLVCSNTRTFLSNTTVIGYWTSSDLVTWDVSTIDLSSTPGAYHIGAPEWFVDDDGSVHILYHNANAAGTDIKFYEVHPATPGNYAVWSTPVELSSVDLPNPILDAFVVKKGATYYLWYKEETTKYIEYASASALTGPYTKVQTGDWAGWGANIEGESLVYLGGTTWRIYVDRYLAGTGMAYSESTDDWATWSALTTLDTPFVARHGTVLDRLA